MTDWVRYPLPWHWDDLDDNAFKERLRELADWVNWFVARYHLARRVPPCWYRHPGLHDELRALWYYHQEMTSPLVPLAQPDPLGGPMEPEDPEVSARAHQDWHEARWRWMIGPLAEAAGYRECLSQQHHVDDGHASDADAFATSSAGRLEDSFREWMVVRPSSSRMGTSDSPKAGNQAVEAL